MGWLIDRIGIKRIYLIGIGFLFVSYLVSVGFLPLGILFAFSQAFAHEVKGAGSYVLGFMVTGGALTPPQPQLSFFPAMLITQILT